MSKIAAVIGRILIAIIFIITGASQLLDVAGTERLIQGVGLPSGFAIAVGAFQVIAGLMLAAGLLVRLVSVLLFVFTALAILFFHNQFTDPVQGALALKDLAIMGGLMMCFAHSQMWWHYYAMRSARRGELAARDAELRRHDAELRAAKAEGIAEASGGRTVTYDTNGDGYADTAVTPRRRRWFDW